jgi:hypothetical protein
MSRIAEFLRKLTQYGDDVVSLKHWLRFTPQKHFPVPISVGGLLNPKDTARLEELGKLKMLMTSLGFDLATFWLVAYCLNQLSYNGEYLAKRIDDDSPRYAVLPTLPSLLTRV